MRSLSRRNPVPGSIGRPLATVRSARRYRILLAILVALAVALGGWIGYHAYSSPPLFQIRAGTEALDVQVDHATRLVWTLGDASLVTLDPATESRATECLGRIQLKLGKNAHVRLTKLGGKVLVVQWIRSGQNNTIIGLDQAIKSPADFTYSALVVGKPCDRPEAFSIAEPPILQPMQSVPPHVAAARPDRDEIPALLLDIEGSLVIGQPYVEPATLQSAVATPTDVERNASRTAFLLAAARPVLISGDVWMKGEPIRGRAPYDASRWELLTGDAVKIGTGSHDGLIDGNEHARALGSVRISRDEPLDVVVFARTADVSLLRRGSEPARLALTPWARLTKDAFLQRIWLLIGAVIAVLNLAVLARDMFMPQLFTEKET